MRACGVWVGVLTCAWPFGGQKWTLLVFLHCSLYLAFETGPLTEPGACGLNQTGWLVNP